jgi:hemerythrin-like domain-containing protein
MSIRIGHKASADSAVALLHACHSNIRRFLATARALASESATTEEDIAATSLSVSRYFREALPLHVADEEESVAPRLSRTDPATEATVARMLGEHASHHALVADVAGLCDALAKAPARRAELAPRLGPAAADLSQTLESHLRWEEETLFPLLPHLSSDHHLAILGEMRRRRGTAPIWP